MYLLNWEKWILAEMLLILEVSLFCFGISLFILLCCLFLFVCLFVCLFPPEIHSEAEFWMPKEHGVFGYKWHGISCRGASVRRNEGLPCDGCSHFHFTGHSWAQQQLLMITYFKKGKKHWTGRSLGRKGVNSGKREWKLQSQRRKRKKATTSSHTVAHEGPHTRAIGYSCGQWRVHIRTPALWEEKSSTENSLVYWFVYLPRWKDWLYPQCNKEERIGVWREGLSLRKGKVLF